MSRPKSKHANNHGIDKRSNTEKLFDDELAVPAPPMMLDIGEERLKLLQKNILSVLCKGCKCCSSVNSVLTETVTFESLLKSENFEKTKPSPKLSTMSPLNMTDRTATEKSSEIINVISNIYVTKSSPKKRSDMKVNLNTRNIKNINEAVLSNSKSDSEVSATEEDNINNATDVGINANIQSQPQKPQSDKKKKRKKRKALYTYFAKGNTKSRKSGADKTSALQAKQSESSDQEPSKGKKRKSLGEDKEVPNGKKKKQEVENIKPENSKEKPKKSDLVKSQKIDKSQIKSQPVKRQSKKKLVAQKLQFSSEEEIVEKSSLENQKQVKGKSSQRGPKGMEKGDSLEVPQEASKNFKANRTYSAKKQTNSGSDLGAKRKTRKVKKVGSPLF